MEIIVVIDYCYSLYELGIFNTIKFANHILTPKILYIVISEAMNHFYYESRVVNRYWKVIWIA